jgi:hypothetical protein
MTDEQTKYICKHIAPVLPDRRGREIGGRCIGFKRMTRSGPLGGIYVFPHIEGKYLYRPNPRNPLELVPHGRVDAPRRRLKAIFVWEVR